MKQLNETQLQENWDKLIGVLNDTFEGERLEKLLTMYNHLQDRMIVAPASAKEEYHNCYVGGYVNHVLHVYENAKRVSELYVSELCSFKDSLIILETFSLLSAPSIAI